MCFGLILGGLNVFCREPKHMNFRKYPHTGKQKCVRKETRVAEVARVGTLGRWRLSYLHSRPEMTTQKKDLVIGAARGTWTTLELQVARERLASAGRRNPRDDNAGSYENSEVNCDLIDRSLLPVIGWEHWRLAHCASLHVDARSSEASKEDIRSEQDWSVSCVRTLTSRDAALQQVVSEVGSCVGWSVRRRWKGKVVERWSLEVWQGCTLCREDLASLNDLWKKNNTEIKTSWKSSTQEFKLVPSVLEPDHDLAFSDANLFRYFLSFLATQERLFPEALFQRWHLFLWEQRTRPASGATSGWSITLLVRFSWISRLCKIQNIPQT